GGEEVRRDARRDRRDDLPRRGASRRRRGSAWHAGAEALRQELKQRLRSRKEVAMSNGNRPTRPHEPKRLARVMVAALIALGAPATAGVVIDQQITMPDAQGAAKTVTHTTMIQGNRMKTVSPESTTIMDLDKGTI